MQRERERAPLAVPLPLVVIALASFAWGLLWKLHDHEVRLKALESRAAWFAPEGQEHPEPVKENR